MLFFRAGYRHHQDLHSFPTRRSSDLRRQLDARRFADAYEIVALPADQRDLLGGRCDSSLTRRASHGLDPFQPIIRSEEHTSELQSHSDLVCRLLLEKKKNAT